jgi:hypothetical protein
LRFAHLDGMIEEQVMEKAKCTKDCLEEKSTTPCI